MNIINQPKYEMFQKWYIQQKYSDKPLCDCDQSELREAISYFISNEENDLVKNIIDAINNNLSFSWESRDLDLFDEAILINNLRNAGYDMLLVDDLPCNTTDLLKLCKKLSWLTIVKCKTIKIINKLKNVAIPWYFIFVIAGLIFYFDILLIMYSLIVTWGIWALTEVPKHDYIEHNYIRPKNTIIKYLIDFILFLLNSEMYANKKGWQKMHDLHHKNWRTDKDTLTYAIDRGILIAMAAYRPFARPNKEDLNEILKGYATFSWIFRYLIEIKILIAITLLLLLGPQLFLYFVAIPASLKLGFEGQHDWYIIRFGERNYWFMWPIALNQAWHLSHHQSYNKAPNTWGDIFQGPTWVRYINPQYYLTILFFKINRAG